MTLTDPYTAILNIVPLINGIVSVRDETRRNPELHWHPVGERPEERCPGCDVAARLTQVLTEAAR